MASRSAESFRDRTSSIVGVRRGDGVAAGVLLAHQHAVAATHQPPARCRRETSIDESSVYHLGLFFFRDVFIGGYESISARRCSTRTRIAGI